MRQAELVAKRVAEAEQRRRLGLSPISKHAASSAAGAAAVGGGLLLEPADPQPQPPPPPPPRFFDGSRSVSGSGTGGGGVSVSVGGGGELSPVEAEAIRRWLADEVGAVKKEVQVGLLGIQKGQAELAEEVKRLSPGSRAAALAKLTQSKSAIQTDTGREKTDGGFGDILHETNIRLRQAASEQDPGGSESPSGWVPIPCHFESHTVASDHIWDVPFTSNLNVVLLVLVCSQTDCCLLFQGWAPRSL